MQLNLKELDDISGENMFDRLSKKGIEQVGGQFEIGRRDQISQADGT